MIGIFDSGSGGLTFLHEVRKLLPDEQYLYFGDYNNCPYGNKTEAEVFELTKAGVGLLRDAGAKLVVLACNTAASAAIKKLQKAEKTLGVKVLGVTIPGAEKVVEMGYKKITIAATNGSVKNKLYKTRVGILNRDVEVQEIGLNELAVLVEEYLKKHISKIELKQYVREKLQYVWSDSEAIVLGCTHYSHIKDVFQELFPKKNIIDPSEEAACKLKVYLQKHPEFSNRSQEYVYKNELTLQVLLYLQTIPRGKVVSYKYLGDMFGVHQRTIASIMKQNKFPSIYPCYKVVAQSGLVSGYNTQAGVSEKIEKLTREGIQIVNGKIEQPYFLN